jgi:ABC-2 type transport system permease protein
VSGERKPGLLLPTATLWERETVRFLRQRNRVAGALGTPLLFWLLLGSGYGSSFRSPGGNSGYLAYFFPGSLVLTLFFTAIYSTISIIEDRREGFLQSVLVAPIPRAAIVLGKVLGGATVALLQALLFLLLAPAAGIPISPTSFAAVTGSLASIAIGLTGLGVLLAWRMESTQGFHAVMNLVLMPMWMLSGALFPIAGAAGWLGWVMRLNPLTYGVASVRTALGLPAPGLPAPAVALGITVGFSLLTFAAATVLAGRRTSAGQP